MKTSLAFASAAPHEANKGMRNMLTVARNVETPESR